LLKTLLNTEEPHLISSDARHVFVKIKQRLYANMPKEGAPQHMCRKEHIKTNWLRTICNVKCIFAQKLIPRQNEKLKLLSANELSVYAVCVKHKASFWEFASDT